MEVAGCGPYTQEAVKAWLKIGGRRLDSADSYNTQVAVGLAMKASGVARKDIFLLQKVGNTNPMGYNETLQQTASSALESWRTPLSFFHVGHIRQSISLHATIPLPVLRDMGVTYVDLMLNHWPTSPATYTSDLSCIPNTPTYDAKECRLNTWRALVEVWKNGQALAIGVANYNSSHLQVGAMCALCVCVCVGGGASLSALLTRVCVQGEESTAV